MKNIEPWEEEYKRRADQKTDLPPELVWDNIEKEIAKPKKRRWFILLFFILAVGCFKLLIQVKTNLVDAKKQVDTSHIVSSQKKFEDNDIENYPTTESLIGTDNYLKGQSFESKSDLRNKLNTEKLIESIENPSSKTISSYDFKSLKSNLDSKFSKIVVDRSVTSSLLYEQQAINEIQNDSIIMSQNVQKDSKIIKKQIISEGELNMPSLFIKLNSITENSNISEILFSKKVIVPKASYYYSRIGLNLAIPYRSLNEALDNSDELLRKEQSTTPWYCFGGSIVVGKVFSNGMYISSGIDFLQIKEKFSVELKGISRQKPDFDPNTGSLIGSSVETGTLISRGENKINMLNVPIMLGYQIQLMPWRFNFETGALVNVYSSFQGKEFQDFNEIVEIEYNDSYLKSNVGVLFRSGIMAGKNFGRNKVNISCHYTQSFQNWSAAESINLRYSFIKIGVGTEYAF